MTVLPFAGQEEERYLTRDQLADLMGVSVDTVDRLRRAGMPSVVFARRSRRFRASIALQWARSMGGYEA